MKIAALIISLVSFSFCRGSSKTCIVTKFADVNRAVNTCLDIVFENLVVPGGQTLKLNLTDGTVVTFKGKTTFEYYSWRGPFVTINGTGVTIQGDIDHVFDGQGQLYWDYRGDSGVPKPQFFTVQTFGGSVMKNIHVLNSPHDVLQVTNSDNVTYSNWFLNNTAGDKEDPSKKRRRIARNTDAFDVWNSTNVVIENALVYNQDDCVALRCGSNISVRNLECHGSHGLSISVGFNNDTTKINPLNVLTNVHFSNCTLYDGDNVIHIKTHNKGGLGFIDNIFYENIYSNGSRKYGIIIEQNYPNHGEPLGNVPIRNLHIEDIYGDIESDAIAVSVTCAQNACENWFWKNIDISGSSKNNSCNYKPIGSNLCDD